MQAAPAGEPFVPPDCFDACNKPVLTISLSGRKLPASSREISEMPVKDFVALWAVSILLNLLTGSLAAETDLPMLFSMCLLRCDVTWPTVAAHTVT